MAPRHLSEYGIKVTADVSDVIKEAQQGIAQIERLGKQANVPARDQLAKATAYIQKKVTDPVAQTQLVTGLRNTFHRSVESWNKRIAIEGGEAIKAVKNSTLQGDVYKARSLPKGATSIFAPVRASNPLNPPVSLNLAQMQAELKKLEEILAQVPPIFARTAGKVAASIQKLRTLVGEEERKNLTRADYAARAGGRLENNRLNLQGRLDNPLDPRDGQLGALGRVRAADQNVASLEALTDENIAHLADSRVSNRLVNDIVNQEARLRRTGLTRRKGEGDLSLNAKLDAHEAHQAAEATLAGLKATSVEHHKTAAQLKDERLRQGAADDDQRDPTLAAEMRARRAAKSVGNKATDLGLPIIPGEGVGQTTARVKAATRNNRLDALIHALQNETQEEIRKTAQLKVLTQRRAAAESAQIQELTATARAEAWNRASFIQRVQSQARTVRYGGSNNRPADTEATGAQFLTSHLLTTASYGASAAALYGVLNVTKDAIKEALSLQAVTFQLKEQADSLNEGGGLKAFRSDLLGLARDTGVAGSEVAFLGLQMRGAFGDTEKAIQATEQALRAAQVSGLPLAEIVDSLTAGAISYDVTIDEITDKSLGIQERFGVTAAQSLKAFGDIAPVAKEAGLELDAIAGILGVIQQRSGKSLSAVTEGLGRILPAVQEKAPEILGEFDTNPRLQAQLPAVQAALGAGKTGDVLLEIAKSWETLDKSAKQYFITQLGGRKEAQYLIPLFEGSNALLKEANGEYNDSGKAIDYQAAKQRTLTYQIRQLREEFNQLIDSLARLGLLQGLALLAQAAAAVLGPLAWLVRLLADWNEAALRIPGTMLAIAVAMSVATKAFKAFGLAQVQLATLRAGGGAGGILSRLLGVVTGKGPAKVAGTWRAGDALTGATAAAPVVARTAATGGKIAGVANAAFGLNAFRAIGGAVPVLGMGALASGLVVSAGVAGLVFAAHYAIAQRKKDAAALKKVQDALGKQDYYTLSQRKIEASQVGGLQGEAMRAALAKPYNEVLDATYHRAIALGLIAGPTKIPPDITEADLAGAVDPLADPDKPAPPKRVALRGRTVEVVAGAHYVPPGQLLTQEDKQAQLDALPPEDRKRVTEARANQEELNEALTDGGNARVNAAEELKRAFAGGEISWREYADGTKHQIDVLSKAGAENAAKALVILRERNAVVAALALKTVETTKSLGELYGRDPNQVTEQAARRALDARNTEAEPESHGDFTSPEVKARLDAIQQAAQAQGLSEDATVAMMSNVKGAAVYPKAIRDPEAQNELIMQIFNAQKASQESVIENALSYADAVAAAEAGVELDPALVQQLTDNLVRLGRLSPEEAAAQVETIISFRNKTTQHLLTQLKIDTYRAEVMASLDPEATELEQALAEKKIAEFNLATGAEDPTRTQNERLGQVRAVNVADHGVNEAKKAKKDDEPAARFELRKAQAGKNNELLAQIAQEEADDEFNRAEDTAGRLRAQAARIRADSEAEDYVRSAVDARRDLLSAVAESMGNLAEVGRLSVEKAADDLLQAQLRRFAGTGDQAAVDTAEAALVRAKTAETTRARSQRTDDLAYLYEFDRITAQQYISSLTAELATIPESQVEARREIERRIKGLRDEMSQDLQFNIGDIKLPTLYTAKRLEAGGGNYGTALNSSQVATDNRVYNIQLNASSSAEVTAGFQTILSALSAAPLTGNRPRTYP